MSTIAPVEPKAVIPNVVTIDARAATYDGEAIRILAVTLVDSGKIVIKRQADWAVQPVKTPNTLVVTDTPGAFNHWGLSFNEANQMREVMAAYKAVMASNLLTIDDALRRYDPQSVIQTRKVDDRGRVMDFDSMGINNGHIAVLLAVWASRKAHGGFVITRPSIYNDADNMPGKKEVDQYDMMPFSV